MNKVRRKLVTMADVATSAGVSITTVSHVINGTASISTETKQRVFHAIRTLNYESNGSTAKITNKKLIALFAPDLSNEFYARCMQAVFEEAWKHGYLVMNCGLQYWHSAVRGYINNLLNIGVSGMIFIGGQLDEKYIENAAKKIPIVLGDRSGFNDSLNCVVTDNTDVMRKLITRLARAGYTKIGYVSEDLVMSNCQERFLGFKIGMEENNLKINPKWVFEEQTLRLNKVQMAHDIFTSRFHMNAELPQIFLCSSDLVAIGVMAALRENGWNIPRQIGVIGFDNITLASYVQPPLTTISQNMEQLGKHCFLSLLDQIINKHHEPKKIVVNAKIIVRESVRL